MVEKAMRSLSEKMHSKVDTQDPEKCWLWQGSLSAQGYGRSDYNGRTILAHRWFWEEANGSIIKRLYLLNHCGNKRCCNPEHYHLSHQSWEPPAKYVPRKLWTDEKIETIVDLAKKFSNVNVAEILGISYNAVLGILRRLPPATCAAIEQSRIEMGADRKQRYIRSTARFYHGSPLAKSTICSPVVAKKPIPELMNLAQKGDVGAFERLLKVFFWKMRQTAVIWSTDKSRHNISNIIQGARVRAFLVINQFSYRLGKGCDPRNEQICAWLRWLTKMQALCHNKRGADGILYPLYGQYRGIQPKILVGIMDEEKVLGSALSERIYEQSWYGKDNDRE